MAVRENVSHMGKLAALQHFEFSRGGLAVDALHLLARDVDRAGELVSLEHPAFHHILDRRTSEAEILGSFRYGDFLAVFVFHPNNLLTRQRRGPEHPSEARIPRPGKT